DRAVRAPRLLLPGSRLDARTARLQPHPRPQGHLGQAPGAAITTCSSAAALQAPAVHGVTLAGTSLPTGRTLDGEVRRPGTSHSRPRACPSPDQELDPPALR